MTAQHKYLSKGRVIAKYISLSDWIEIISPHFISLHIAIPLLTPPVSQHLIYPPRYLERQNYYGFYTDAHYIILVMSFKGNPAFFKPPPETYSMFTDLVEDDDDQGEGEPERNLENPFEENGKRPVNFKKEDNNDDGDEPAVFMNKSSLTKSRHLPKYLRQPQHAPTSSMDYLYTPIDKKKPQSPYQRLDSYSSEESQLPTAPSLRPHTADNYAHARMLPTAGGGQLSIYNSNVFMSKSQRKRMEQKERLDNAEESLLILLEESPHDTKVRGKLLQIQTWKQKFEEDRSQLLNASQVKILYEIDRSFERRQVMNETKAFERMAEAEIEAGGYLYGAACTGGGKKARKHAREEGAMSFCSSDSGSVWAGSAADYSYSPNRPTTGGKKPSQAQEAKRQKLHSISQGHYADAENEDDDKDGERKTYGGKTIGKGEEAKVGRFDVDAVLENDAEVTEQEHSQDDERNESSDVETEESSDTDGEVEVEM